MPFGRGTDSHFQQSQDQQQPAITRNTSRQTNNPFWRGLLAFFRGRLFGFNISQLNQMETGTNEDFMQIGEIVERTIIHDQSYFPQVQTSTSYTNSPFQMGFLQQISNPILHTRDAQESQQKLGDVRSSNISTEHESTHSKHSHQMLHNLCPQTGKRKLSTLNFQFKMQQSFDSHSRKQMQKMCRMQLSEIQPHNMKENQIHVGRWLGQQQQPIDKIFAANWLNEEEIVLGTKCNNLVVVNALSGKMKNVPTIGRQQNEYNPRIINYGIHTISINPSKTLMLTGGEEPQDAAIYSIQKNNQKSDFKFDLKPKQLLIQHRDWLFGSAWISDDCVVTASRDKSLCMWQIPMHAYNNQQDEDNTRIQIDRLPRYQVPSVLHGTDDVGHLDKIRDVRFSGECGRLVTLGLEGRVMLWDLQMQQVRKIKLSCRNELACMHVKENLIAVGSKTCVTFVDIRSRKQILDVPTPDSQYSVRSICMRDHVLSTGNGRGRLHFFDIRANKWLTEYTCDNDNNHNNDNNSNNQQALYLQSSEGSLRNWELFRSVIRTPAIYSHSWSPCETKLVLAGGPLQCGMEGAYLGIWE
eukprot:TRINITY_DN29703_c0_g1_i1.p1 TRINITY_DN29703_c0_g1~~TRINITY_DN29703_c0_g1_i1.p1  ORF type:complete len:581 (+),score=84.70 TRINITY_DN29703_c0_g1_i1:111-1853(+)